MNSIDQPNRKNIRLKNYDYSQPGYYFVTICTHNKQNILCNIVGAGFHARPGRPEPPRIKLTKIGLQVEKTISGLSSYHKGISIDKYVIMPNHVHLIIIIGEESILPLSDIIGGLKSYTTYEYNKIIKTKYLPLWQRSYYEHVVRFEKELDEIREYIQNNPISWDDDEYSE